MPKWKGPSGHSETWTWVDDDGHVLATVSREEDHWVVKSTAAHGLDGRGRVGEAPSRREATAMLTYDRLTRTAQESERRKLQRRQATREVAIRTLGFAPEPEGAGYQDEYAGTTGELLSWAREKKSLEQLDREIAEALRRPRKTAGKSK